MKLRVFAVIAAVAFFIAPVLRCQSDSMIHVNQFPGSTVADKVTAAMQWCPTAPVPCILIVDASLAQATTGTMPTLCGNCFLDDYRNGPPSGHIWPSAVTDSGGQVFNCKAFGVKGDGTTDDMAAAQACINAAAAVRGTALFPPSLTRYVISGFLNLPEYVILKGESGATLFFTGYRPWAATSTYNLNALITDGNGCSEQVTTAGVSGSSAPTWPTCVYTSAGTTTTDGTITWTNESTPSCGKTTSNSAATGLNENAGFLRFTQGGNRVTGLIIEPSLQTAGTCILNVNDGTETSFVEIDHDHIYGGSTGSTNDGIYMYSTDTDSIHDNIVEYVDHAINVGLHTMAQVNIGPHNVFSTGTVNADYLVQLPGGLNCFQNSVNHNTFEGYQTTNYLNSSSCSNGFTNQDNYFGDPSATAGNGISGNNQTLIDDYLVGPSNGYAVNPGTLSTYIGNWFYGKLAVVSGEFINNTFEGGPSAGCFITMNQGEVITSIQNNFTASGGAANSYCAANSLTPHPIVRQIGDTDSTTNGIKAGVTVMGIGNVPTLTASLPSCTVDREGNVFPVTDSTTNIIGATITGGGTNHVQAYCGTDGTTYAWRVSATTNLSGTGNVVTIASGTASMGTAAVPSGSCATTVTVAAAGVLTTDTISWSYSAWPGATAGLLTVTRWPTSGNVDFAYCNPTASSIIPIAETINWAVRR